MFFLLLTIRCFLCFKCPCLSVGVLVRVDGWMDGLGHKCERAVKRKNDLAKEKALSPTIILFS